MKYNVVEGAKQVVDIAMDMSGGAGLYKTNEIERLYRDVRAGAFTRPTPTSRTRSSARAALGIGLDEMPRWG